MATRTEILETVITPMRRLFGRPFGVKTDAEESGAEAEYISAFSRFTPAQLVAAWEDVRDGWKKTTWPPIGLFVEALGSPPREKSDGKKREPHWRDQVIADGDEFASLLGDGDWEAGRQIAIRLGRHGWAWHLGAWRETGKKRYDREKITADAFCDEGDRRLAQWGRAQLAA